MGDTITFFQVISKVLFGYQEDIQGSSASLHYYSVVQGSPTKISFQKISFSEFIHEWNSQFVVFEQIGGLETVKKTESTSNQLKGKMFL